MKGILIPILQMEKGLEIYQMPSLCQAFADSCGIFLATLLWGIIIRILQMRKQRLREVKQ